MSFSNTAYDEVLSEEEAFVRMEDIFDNRRLRAATYPRSSPRPLSGLNISVDSFSAIPIEGGMIQMSQDPDVISLARVILQTWDLDKNEKISFSELMNCGLEPRFTEGLFRMLTLGEAHEEEGDNDDVCVTLANLVTLIEIFKHGTIENKVSLLAHFVDVITPLIPLTPLIHFPSLSFSPPSSPSLPFLLLFLFFSFSRATTIHPLSCAVKKYLSFTCLKAKSLQLFPAT